MRQCVIFATGKTNTTRPSLNWRRWRATGVACSMIVACACVGCDSFVPPKPEELREASNNLPASVTDTFQARTTPETGASQAKSIDVVLGPHDDDEAELWKGAIRTQAGRDRAIIKIFGPADPPATQADLVRETVSHHPGVLVVDLSTPAEPLVIHAIEEAQVQGIPVVVIGRLPANEKIASKAASETEAKSGGSAQKPPPLVVVAPQPFEVSAKQLVATAIRACRQSDVDPGKSAIVLRNPAVTPFLKERGLALVEAIKAAGITKVDELQISADAKSGDAALGAKLKSNPETVLIFTVDSVTSGVIREFVKNETDHRFFVAAGYINDDIRVDLTKFLMVAAVADFTPTRLVRKAITTAVAVAQQQDVPRLVELPIDISDSLASPAMLKAAALQWEKAKAESEKAKKK